MRNAILALLLTTTAAKADMIDYGFRFSNAAAALADATLVAGQYSVTNGWLVDHAIPGIQCWRPSQDVTGSVANPFPPPATLPTVTHTYLTGYLVLVSINSASPIPALLNDANLAFALDRTAREAGQSFVVQNNIGAVLSDLACAPMFASFNPYPIGGYQ